MNWIKATKTKLYRLIAEYKILPKMRYTDFFEATDLSSYFLEWHTDEGIHYRACYKIENNSPQLEIQYKKKQNKIFVNYSVYELDFRELVTKGMIRGVRSENQITNMIMKQPQLLSSIA